MKLPRHRSRAIESQRLMSTLFPPQRRLEMINGAPSNCSGFPSSSAASRRSGRSDRSRYPNEGEENRRVGGLIGYTWKTTVSSLKCKTPGRGRRDRLAVRSHLFPSDSEGGKKSLPLFRQLSFLRFVLNKIVGDNPNVRGAAEETREQHKYYPRHRSAKLRVVPSVSVTWGKIPSGNLLYSVRNEPLPKCRVGTQLRQRSSEHITPVI